MSNINWEADDLKDAFNLTEEQIMAYNSEIVDTIRCLSIEPIVYSSIAVRDAYKSTEKEIKGKSIAELMNKDSRTFEDKVEFLLKGEMVALDYDFVFRPFKMLARVRERLPHIPEELMWMAIGNREALSNTIFDIKQKVELIFKYHKLWKEEKDPQEKIDMQIKFRAAVEETYIYKYYPEITKLIDLN